MIESFDIIKTTELIKTDKGKSIQLLGFWVELDGTWTNSYYFSFRYGNEPKDYFKKSTSGVAAINLTDMGKDATLPPNVSLNGYISGGNAHVHITLIYKIV